MSDNVEDMERKHNSGDADNYEDPKDRGDRLYHERKCEEEYDWKELFRNLDPGKHKSILEKIREETEAKEILKRGKTNE